MKNVLLFSLILLSVKSYSQNPINEPLPFIEVIGNAELKITPNQIYIAITIHEKWEGKDKITVDVQEEKLKTELTKLNIDLKNLELSDENANNIRVKWTKKDVLAKTKYVLMVKDAQTVRNVFEKLSIIKIYDAKIFKVSHSKIEDYKEEVRIKAIKNAKNKASYLLAAIGQTVGKVILVHENANDYKQQTTYGVYKPKNYLISNNYDMNRTYIEPLNFQKITLSSSIYVKFLID